MTTIRDLAAETHTTVEDILAVIEGSDLDCDIDDLDDDALVILRAQFDHAAALDPATDETVIVTIISETLTCEQAVDERPDGDRHYPAKDRWTRTAVVRLPSGDEWTATQQWVGEHGASAADLLVLDES